MKKILFFVVMLVSFSVKAAEGDRIGQSFADLVDKLLPGVVNISTLKQVEQQNDKVNIISSNEHIRDYFLHDEGGRTSLGSGFLIDAKGYIVTNNHVVDGADEIEVRLNDDRQFKAVVIGRDEMTDLALIKIENDTPLPFVKLGNSDDLRVGDWILAIGNPFGLGGSVTAGIVSAKSRDIDAGSYDNFIQTDASINQGSSGGPMFNMKGDVVGINTAIFSSTGGSMGIGFATPINLSKFVIEQLKDKGVVERGWIGVKVISSTEDIVLSDNNIYKKGVVVSSVMADSPAALSGIEAGDIIISFNGVDVKDAKGFSRTIAEMSKGTKIILRVWRNNQLKDFTVEIDLMPNKTETQINQKYSSLLTERPKGYIEDLGIIVEEQNAQVVIVDVLADSNAAVQGLEAGTIIQKADGKEVSTIEDLKSYVAYAKTVGGPPLEVKVLNDGMPQVLKLKVLNDDQN